MGKGFLLEAGDQPLELTIEKYGNIVTKAWYGIIASGADDIVVVEGYLSLEKADVING